MKTNKKYLKKLLHKHLYIGQPVFVVRESYTDCYDNGYFTAVITGYGYNNDEVEVQLTNSKDLLNDYSDFEDTIIVQEANIYTREDAAFCAASKFLLEY